MKQTSRFKTLLLGSVMLLNIVYILWRIFFTLPFGQGYLSFFFAMGLLGAELLALLELFVTVDGIQHAYLPPLPDITGVEYPDVDVFIATYNEEVALVRKTILGCKNMQYPDANKVHIYLCDDGKRAEMQQLAKELSVHYLARSDRKGAKAGNLNHALAHSTSPYIVTFDADMIPLDCFLLETIPYFLAKRGKDEAPIGFVQTPQSFYNPDLFQVNFFANKHIPNEQDYFYRSIQSNKNYANCVIYGGSNTVILRESLLAVEGFYQDSITEDFATGILIQGKGYQCYATKKILATGLSPHDIKSLCNQRERWARGCIQTVKQLKIFRHKGLSIRQKIACVAAVSYWYSCLKRFFYIMCPIAYAVFGIKVIECSLREILVFFVPMYLLTNYCVNRNAQNMRTTGWTNIYETIFFPTLSKAVLLESIGISKRKFSVTDKSGAVKKDASTTRKVVPFYVYLGLSFVGIANIILYGGNYQNLDFIVIFIWLVVNSLYLLMAIFFMHSTNSVMPETEYAVDFSVCATQGVHRMQGISKIMTAQTLVLQLAADAPYLQQTKPVSLQIMQTEGGAVRQCNVMASAVLLREEGGTRYYQCTRTNCTQRDYDTWFIWLHNRLPNLPRVMVGSTNLVYCVQWNILQRVRLFCQRYCAKSK